MLLDRSGTMHRRGEDQSEIVSTAEVGTAPETFTADEVARHNTPSDCWLLIHGKVYDVTRWVPHHPGGSMIFVRVGGDCSQLFDSYHPLTTRCVLCWSPLRLLKRLKCIISDVYCGPWLAAARVCLQLWQALIKKPNV